MKRLLALLGLLFLLAGCAPQDEPAKVAATTLPVYEFTAQLCKGTDITVTRLVTENVSCLHDYTLSVRQVKAAEAAELVILSGAGLEDFMADLLANKTAIDASQGLPLLGCEHDHDHHHEHDHEADPHIWLSPANAIVMAENICRGLIAQYPRHKEAFEKNLAQLSQELAQLQAYGKEQLGSLSCRKLITFHDGFAYLADAFDLTVLRAIEEESGSEASAAELKELCGLVWEHQLPAVFTEVAGSTSAAEILAAETGVCVYALDMAMGNSGYLEAMYHNIDTIKEALG